MSKPSLLIVGCGDLGKRVGSALAREGWRVGALRRNPPTEPGVFEWIAADYTRAGSLDFAGPWHPDYVLTCFSPPGRDVQAYRSGFAAAAGNLLRGLGEYRPRHLVMVSSTRVYAEADGRWVDEDSPLASRDDRAAAIIDAERALLDSPHRATVVRCGGVYGAVPGRLVEKVAGGDIAPPAPLRYTNRIHREDAAGFLLHLLRLRDSGQPLERVYNCVDDLPASAYEVESWLARRLGIAPRGARVGNPAAPVNHKRCRNRRLHASGYTLRYPDYRAGYGRVLETGPLQPLGTSPPGPAPSL